MSCTKIGAMNTLGPTSERVRFKDRHETGLVLAGRLRQHSVHLGTCSWCESSECPGTRRALVLTL